MPENGGIAKLALQGGSEEGYGSLPTDFGVVKGTKKRGKGVCKLGGKGCTVYSDAQCFKYRDGGDRSKWGLKFGSVTELPPGGYTPLNHSSLVNTTSPSW
nr:hypothetical protein [Tanacetum cinerariifolium]